VIGYQIRPAVFFFAIFVFFRLGQAYGATGFAACRAVGLAGAGLFLLGYWPSLIRAALIAQRRYWIDASRSEGR